MSFELPVDHSVYILQGHAKSNAFHYACARAVSRSTTTWIVLVEVSSRCEVRAAVDPITCKILPESSYVVRSRLSYSTLTRPLQQSAGGHLTGHFIVVCITKGCVRRYYGSTEAGQNRMA